MGEGEGRTVALGNRATLTCRNVNHPFLFVSLCPGGQGFEHLLVLGPVLSVMNSKRRLSFLPFGSRPMLLNPLLTFFITAFLRYN